MLHIHYLQLVFVYTNNYHRCIRHSVDSTIYEHLLLMKRKYSDVRSKFTVKQLTSVYSCVCEAGLQTNSLYISTLTLIAVTVPYLTFSDFSG